MIGRAAVRNAADREQVQRAAQRERDTQGLYEAALAEVMDTAAGRVVVWTLLERAGLFRTSLGPDALAIAAAEGRRQYGLELYAELERVCPDRLELARREARLRTSQEGA